MTKLTVYFLMGVCLPVAFGVLLWFFLLRIDWNFWLASGVGLYGAYVLYGQAVKNAKEYLAEPDNEDRWGAGVLYALSFSFPFLVSVIVAQFAETIDYHLNFFSPAVTGVLVGLVLFFVSYAAIHIDYGPLREVFIGGRQVHDSRDARRTAKRQGFQDGFLFGGVKIPPRDALLHFLVAGATGSGKTVTIRLLLQEIHHYLQSQSERRVVLYDPKGTMLPVLAGFEGPKMPVLDLHPFRQQAVAWDLARDLADDNDILNLSLLLIAEEQGDAENKFFVDAPRRLLQGVIRGLKQRRGDQWTFRDLILSLLDEQAMRSLLSTNRRDRQTATNYLDGDERTKAGIQGTLQGKLMRYEPIASAWDAAARQGRAVSLRQWLQDGSGYLLLGSDKTDDSAIDAINRVIIDLCKKYWLESSVSAQEPHSFLVLDELASAGRLKGLGSLLKEGREKGVSVLLGFQDIADLQAIYGVKEAESFLAQPAQKAFLRMEGDLTPQWAARVVGEMEQFEYTYSQAVTVGESTQTTRSRHEHRVRKSALMASSFTTIPSTNLKNGLTGYYSAPTIGVWEHTYPGEKLFAGGMLTPIESSAESSIQPTGPLADWDEQELLQLGLEQIDEPPQRQPDRPNVEEPEQQERAQLRPVRRIDPDELDDEN